MNPTYDGTAGLNGVFVPAGANAASLVNFGEISGSVGDYSGNGGTGVYLLAAAATINNQGQIYGGGAGEFGFSGGGFSGGNGNGGIGVDIASAATLQNSGLIQGGLGEFASDGFPAGNGGTGVSLAPSATLTNFGRIIAGQGGGSFEGEPGAGGVGAHLGAGAVAFNYGYISGGRGGAFMTSNLFDQFGIGGSGVYIGQTATLTNEAGGLIQGGGQGAGAVQLAANATLNNAGTIFGGAGNYNIGVAAVTGDIITNTGTISGGTGPAGDFFGGPSPPGGTGVMLAGGSASNSGSIFGGAAGLYGPGAGGEGIYLGSDAIFTNSGLVTGGSGGNGEVIADLSDEYDYAGNGGAGVYLDGGMLAEGCWAESFADGPGLRGQFDNAAEFCELHPDDVPPAALQLCAPRPEAGPALDAALRPVAARAAALVKPGKLAGFIDFAEPDRIEGWAHDPANPDLPVLLEIRLGDALLATLLACDFRADLAQAGMGRGRCAFFFKPFHPLEAASLRGLRIRCAATGEELAMTGNCQAVIDTILALAA